jgi:hypothetical protein
MHYVFDSLGADAVGRIDPPRRKNKNCTKAGVSKVRVSNQGVPGIPMAALRWERLGHSGE